MPKTRSGWKSYERRVAEILGGARIPVTGRTGPGDDPGDVALPGWYIEVRDRNILAVGAWFREVVYQARVGGTRPMLVVKVPGTRCGPVAVLVLRDLVEVMRDARFARAFGPLQDAPDRRPAAAGGDVAGDARGRGSHAGAPAVRDDRA